jgi:hypothetical protein
LSSVYSSGVSRSILAGKVERSNFALDPPVMPIFRK